VLSHQDAGENTRSKQMIYSWRWLAGRPCVCSFGWRVQGGTL